MQRASHFLEAEKLHDVENRPFPYGRDMKIYAHSMLRPKSLNNYASSRLYSVRNRLFSELFLGWAKTCLSTGKRCPNLGPIVKWNRSICQDLVSFMPFASNNDNIPICC